MEVQPETVPTFAKPPHSHPQSAAQIAWDWIEIIAVLMLAAGTLLTVLGLLNGSGLKGAISLLSMGGALLILSLTLSNPTAILIIEIIGGVLGIAALVFAGWEIWTHRKQIESQMGQSNQTAANPPQPPAVPGKANQ